VPSRSPVLLRSAEPILLRPLEALTRYGLDRPALCKLAGEVRFYIRFLALSVVMARYLQALSESHQHYESQSCAATG
jgi:hypothetical protein